MLLALHFKVVSSHWPSDWLEVTPLYITCRLLAKFGHKDRNKYRGWQGEAEVWTQFPEWVMCGVRSVAARCLMLGATWNVSLIDMKSHVIQPQSPQPSNTLPRHTIHHQERKYYQMEIHVLVKFLSSPLQWSCLYFKTIKPDKIFFKLLLSTQTKEIISTVLISENFRLKFYICNMVSGEEGGGGNSWSPISGPGSKKTKPFNNNKRRPLWCEATYP